MTQSQQLPRVLKYERLQIDSCGGMLYGLIFDASNSDTCNNTQQQPFHGPLSGTTRVSRYQKKHSPAHHPGPHPIFISFFHLPRSIASTLFKLHAWQSFCITSQIIVNGIKITRNVAAMLNSVCHCTNSSKQVSDTFCRFSLHFQNRF